MIPEDQQAAMEDLLGTSAISAAAAKGALDSVSLDVAAPEPALASPPRDYTNNLDDMQAAEETLTPEEFAAYAALLWDGDHFLGANASARSEAFLKVKGRWIA